MVFACFKIIVLYSGMIHTLPPSEKVTNSQTSVSSFAKRINYLDESTSICEENVSDIFLNTEAICNSDQDITRCS